MENKSVIGNEKGKEADDQSVAAQTSATNKYYAHTDIKGRWDQFRSPYWGLAIAAIGIRYLFRPFTRNFWDTAVKTARSAGYFESITDKGYVAKYTYSLLAGVIMYGVALFYAGRTMGDMKRVFSETVGYETHKKPEDVSAFDILRSKNVIIQQTRKNFFKYNFRRFAINTVFFMPFIPGLRKALGLKTAGGFINIADHAETPLDWGAGANSAYLVTDIIWRKETFFEKLQNFIDIKINHTDRIGDVITTSDLISLYDRHAHDLNSRYTMASPTDTQRRKNNDILFGRMAELMNETYGNIASNENAEFTVPKLVYLLGNGYIDPENVEQSLAYIEIANRRKNMDAIKKIADAIDNGTPWRAAVAPFISQVSAQHEENEKDNNSFVAGLAGDRSNVRDLRVPANSNVEKIAQQKLNTQSAPSVG